MAEAGAKHRVALMSVGVSVFLAILKLVGGWASGSLALVSEGLHNGLDGVGGVLVYIAIRFADRPADEGHPFGHGKMETIAALAESLLLIMIAIGVAVLAWLRLGTESHVHAQGGTFLALGVAMFIDILRWGHLRRVAHRTGSEALAAEALHYATDGAAAAFVAMGLVATRWGWPHADAFAAFGVAMFMMVSALRMGAKTIVALVDTAPKGLADEIRGALASISRIVDVDHVRLRRVGGFVMGELGLVVARTHPLETVAAIQQQAQALLAARWPHMRLTIATLPRALDDETVLERLLLIAARRRLLIHHVTVQNRDGNIAIALDLEVDGPMPHADAQTIVCQLEEAISQSGMRGEPILRGSEEDLRRADD